jgi:hypothetical protein
VDKEVQVAEEPGQIQLPDLSQKMKDKKTKCRYYKTETHLITYYSYKHELFSGIAIEKI